MNDLRKREKLSVVQLFTFTQAVPTSPLITDIRSLIHFRSCVNFAQQWKSTLRGPNPQATERS